jgi:flagellar protein FlaG
MEVNTVNTLQDTKPVMPLNNAVLPINVAGQNTDKNSTPVKPIVTQDNTKETNSNNKVNNDTKANYKSVADTLQQLLDDNSNFIQFVKDKESDTMVLKIINSKTKEVVRQIPPEVSLKIARYIESLSNFKVTNFKA